MLEGKLRSILEGIEMYIGFPWLRLVLAKEKNIFISYDPEHIYEAEHTRKNVEARVQRFTEYKRQNQIQYIMPVEPSSDEEDSDDESPIDFNYFT